MADQRNWRGWYGLARWRRLRDRQLDMHPLCAFCFEQDDITPADVVDHIKPHKGDAALFWDEENVQSLCKRHHDRDKQMIERGRELVTIGVDGYPVE